jgi:hypothetical protein
MHVTAVYRTYDGDNGRDRPSYFDKLAAFQSFLLSWRHLPPANRRLIIALNSPRMPAPFQRLFDRYADEVRVLAEPGKKTTYRTILRWVDEMPDDGLAYFAEDDYLYLPEAMSEIAVAAASVPHAHYFTPYDHPDRYVRTDDMHFGRRDFVAIAGHRHWRTVESTCSTYAVRVSTMRRDGILHRALCYTGRIRDRMAFRLVQGIGPYFWKFPKRHLLGPVPSLGTHLEQSHLAPLIDWAAVAERTAQDARTLLE